MKITGKIITLFLVLATLVFLVACNSGNDPISVESTVPETTKGRTDKEETTPEKIPESSTPAVSTAPTPSTTAPESETQPDTSNKVSEYDVSENGDGSLTATFTPNEDGQTYTLEFKGSGNMCSFLEDLQLHRETVTNVIIPEGVTSLFPLREFKNITEIVIPESITELRDDAFYQCTSLRSVTLPNGLIRIGTCAFSGCTALESINLPEGLEEICIEAFSYCTSLPEIIIPSSVKKLGSCIFYECDSLEKLTIPFTGAGEGDTSNDFMHIFSGDFYHRENTHIPSTVILSGGDTIPSRAFQNSRVEYVILPDTITSIGESAFSGCKYLRSIDLPDGIEYLPQWVFGGCYRLREVDLPKQLFDIGMYAFSGCRSLTSLHLYENLAGISTYAFEGCYRLVEIINHSATLPAADIYSVNFQGAADEHLTVHTGADSLLETTVDGMVYFNGMLIDYVGSATEITVDAATVLDCALAFNDNITSVIITGNVKSLGQEVFWGCESLRSVKVEEGVEVIPESCFSDCPELTDISLPSTITSIGEYAFSGCGYARDNDNWIDGILYLGSYMLNVNGEFDSLNIRPGTTLIADNATRYSMSFDAADVTKLTLPDGLLYIGNSSFAWLGITELTIPDSVVSIGGSAFFGCESLEKITLPANPSIGQLSYKFGANADKSAVKEIIITEGDSIYDYMFCNFNFAPDTDVRLVIPQGLTKIGEYAFSHCTGLCSITIPEGITEMSKYSFYSNQSLVSLTLPSTIEKLAEMSVNNNKALKNIHFNGTEAAWSAIEKPEDWCIYVADDITMTFN